MHRARIRPGIPGLLMKGRFAIQRNTSHCLGYDCGPWTGKGGSTQDFLPWTGAVFTWCLCTGILAVPGGSSEFIGDRGGVHHDISLPFSACSCPYCESSTLPESLRLESESPLGANALVRIPQARLVPSLARAAPAASPPVRRVGGERIFPVEPAQLRDCADRSDCRVLARPVPLNSDQELERENGYGFLRKGRLG